MEKRTLFIKPSRPVERDVKLDHYWLPRINLEILKQP